MASSKIKGITVEIGGDTSKLGKAIADSEKQTRSLQGELRQIEKLLQFDPTNTELLAQKQKALAEMVDATSSKLDVLKEAEAQVVEQFERGEIGEDQLRAFQREIIKTESDLNNMSDALDVATRNLEEFGDNNGVRRELDQLGDSAENAGDSAKDGTDGFTVMKGALASLTADGIEKALNGLKELASLTTEWDQASNTFQARTGASAEEMEKFNDAMEAVYTNNFGESMEEVANSMAKVKEVTGEIDPSKLQEMTENAMTLEDTFDMDMSETLRGVNALMDHFGLTSEQAFDLIASGAQNGLNYTDELGDNVSEYAGKFAEAGYSSSEYFQLLKNGAEGGAYNLDKVNDSINEVTTRLADGTIEDSLKSFSSNTQDVFKAWQNGEATQKQVIDSIVTDIQNTKSEQEKMNLAALAFGTMAEDGGTQFIEALSSVGDSFDDVKGKMDEIKETRYDDIGSALSGLGRTIETDLVNPIGEKLTPKIQGAIDYINDHSEEIQGVIDSVVDKVGEFIDFVSSHGSEIISIIAGIGAGLLAWNVATMISGVVSAIKAFQLANEGATVAQALLNAVMNANPIVLIVSLIAMLVAGIVTFIATNDDARAKIVEVWETIKTTVGGVVDALIEFFTVTIPEAFDSFVEGVKSLPEKIQTVFTETIPGLIDKAIQFFSEMPEKIGYAIGYAIGTLITWGANMVSTVKAEVPKIISNVITFFKELPGKIWNAIVSAVTSIATWTSQMREKASAGIKQVSSAVVDGVKSIPEKMLDIGSNIVKGLWNGINNMVSWVKDKVKGFAGSVVDGVKDALGIHSPSRVFEKEVGEQIANGLIKGIDNKKENAKKSSDELASIYVSTAKTKISALEKANKITLAGEVAYWKEIKDTVAKNVSSQSKAYENYIKQRKELKSKLDKLETSAKSLKKGSNAYKANEKEQKAVEASLSALEKKYKETSSNIEKALKARNEANSQYLTAKKKLNEELTKLEKQYSTDVAKVKDQLVKDIQTVTDAYDKAIEDRKNAITSSLNLFDQFNADETISKDTLVNNLQSQVDALSEWDAVLTSLENRKFIPDDMMEDLENMGVSSLETLKQIQSMSDEELAKYVSLYELKDAIAEERAKKENEDLLASSQKQIQDLIDQADKDLNKLEKTYNKNLKSIGVTTADQSVDIGKNIVDGLMNGISSKQDELQSYLTSYFGSIVSTAQSALGIHSPSRVFADLIGANISAGIAKGISDNAGLATGAVKSLSDSLASETDGLNGLNLERKINASFGLDRSGGTIGDVMNTIRDYGEKLIEASSRAIVLDSGVLVGETINQIDSKLGATYNLRTRRI